MAIGEGLLDFGGGAFEGAATGAKISKGNPYVTGGSAIAGGLISLFGGQGQRRMESKYNKQQLKLGEFEIDAMRRKEAKEREADKKRKLIGQMLGEYFQRKAGVG